MPGKNERSQKQHSEATKLCFATTAENFAFPIACELSHEMFTLYFYQCLLLTPDLETSVQLPCKFQSERKKSVLIEYIKYPTKIFLVCFASEIPDSVHCQLKIRNLLMLHLQFGRF